MPVSLINKHPRITPPLVRRMRQVVHILLEQCDVADQRVNIVFTGDEEIHQLNSQYRDRQEPTNVLSFPFNDGAEPAIQALDLNELGDIVISVDRAVTEAADYGQPFDLRLSWLVTHGLLHLLGYDHERSEHDAQLMSNKEKQLLKKIKQAWRIKMAHLAVNVDHVATIRQARGITEPDPVTAAAICELAGAEGIVVHLREDRRHIQDRDVRILRETVQTKLNLEMGAAKEIISLALSIKPDMVTLVPEKRQELTTEGGLDIVSQQKKLARTIAKMTKAGIPVSLFIDPDLEQVSASHAVGATFVELHTGRYADTTDENQLEEEFSLIQESAEAAHQLGLRVNAGHGLNYTNTAPIAAIDCIEELSIGHAIISRSVFSGLERAVLDMRDIIIGASTF